MFCKKLEMITKNLKEMMETIFGLFLYSHTLKKGGPSKKGVEREGGGGIRETIKSS
jgi:hypothetical protein